MIYAAASPDPVSVYYDSLDRLHLKVRQNTPFTYLAYKSMVPSRDDDFISLAYKISYYIAFKFLIHFGVRLLTPLLAAVPYVPLSLDLLWVGYHWIQGETLPGQSPITSLFFLTFSLAAMYTLDKLPEY